MSKKMIMRIREAVCVELESLMSRGLSMNSLDAIYKLVDIMVDTYKIEAMADYDKEESEEGSDVKEMLEELIKKL